MRQLTGPEIEELMEAIKRSFSRENLEMFMRFRLDRDYPFIHSTDINYSIFKMINDANRGFWHNKLIDAFLAERPHFPNIFKIAQDLEVAASFYRGSEAEKLNPEGLEALVRDMDHVSMDDFSSRIQLIERTVCSIRLETTSGKRFFGTGFLVGPDLLLSNYHVFKLLIKTPEAVRKCRFLFDYKSSNTGLELGLAAENPVVAYSPVSTIENAEDINTAWPAGQFDYALVQLERKIGLEPFGINESGMPLDMATPDNRPPRRHWITARAQSLTLVPHQSKLFIAQHPKGSPMKFNVGNVLGIHPHGLRLRYDVNTEGGSSGSPVFNEKLEWIGLHNFGDPTRWAPPEYNQGIPVDRILEDLQANGYDLIAKQAEWKTLL